MGPASEDEPVRLEDRRHPEHGPAADTTTVPDEVHVAALFALEQAGVRHAQLRQHYIEAILGAITVAGWVLVPGPVHQEWAYRYPDGATSYPTSRQQVERLLAADVSAIAVTRQATEWRPAESTQEGHQ